MITGGVPAGLGAGAGISTALAISSFRAMRGGAADVAGGT
jgi:NAD-dependent SIR2 family protein deacetylase